MLAPMRDSLKNECHDQQWSAAARACFADAVDYDVFTACGAQLTPTQQATAAARAAK